MPRDENRCQGHTACRCDHHGHAQAGGDGRTSRTRFGWLTSRMGRATSTGLGGGLISAVIFTPCPCCGGVIVACLRGLLSAGIGLVVGVFAYRRKPAAGGDGFVVSPGPALERE